MKDNCFGLLSSETPMLEILLISDKNNSLKLFWKLKKKKNKTETNNK